MGYFNRFLLLVYALAIAAATLGIIALCLHILPTDEVLNEVKFLLSRWETIAAAAIGFFWSVHLLVCSLSAGGKEKRSHDEMFLLSGTTGKVSVSVEAVKNLVEKTALSASGVRDVKAKVHAESLKDGGSSLHIRLLLVVGQDVRVTEIADSVRNDVMKNVDEVLGLAVCKVDVDISDLVSGTPSARPRVV